MTNSPEKNSTGSGGESFSARDEQVVAALEQICSAMEAGRPLDRQRILERFSDVANELEKCFDGLRIFHDVAPPIGAVTHSSPDLENSERDGAQALGDFRILRQLGRGGMGVVYEAVQQSLDRHIALKVLPFASLLDNRQLQRFKNEVRAAAMLKHPNIVSVYQTGCQRGVHYYAMELVEGQNLAELIEQLLNAHESLRGESSRETGHVGGVAAANERKGNPSPNGSPTQSSTAVPEAAVASQQSDTPTQPVAEISTEYAGDRTNFFRSVARIGIQAAEALEYAHQMGVVHRDIKPSNLMLDRDGRVCLTDFGLAATRSDAGLTQTGLNQSESLSPVPGDANGDSRFDQRDLVQVLQAAKYLTAESVGFEQGDWNGDGVFDQLDVVAALQTGTYLEEAAVDEAMRQRSIRVLACSLPVSCTSQSLT